MPAPNPIESPLRVAVTGHRNPTPASADRLATLVPAELLRIVEASRPRPIVLLSPLAEGADQIAARAAVKVGVPIECPIPLPISLYEQDFGPEALAEFRALASLARSVESIPIPDDLTEADIADYGSARDRMYEAVGRHVVDRCDVLLALWDGVENGKTGGTAETVKYARSIGREVIVLPMQRRSGAR